MGEIIKKDASTIEQEEYDRLKEELPDKVKKNANDLINNRFPQFEQRNLANGTKTEIRDRQTDEMISQSEMNSLINDMINATEELEADINNADTLSDLEAIDVSKPNLKSKADW